MGKLYFLDIEYYYLRFHHNMGNCMGNLKDIQMNLTQDNNEKLLDNFQDIYMDEILHNIYMVYSTGY